MAYKKLYKSRTNVKIDGVCAGLANYLSIDPTAVRLVWLLGTMFSGFFIGIIAYFLCSVIIPREPNYIDEFYD